MAKKPSLNKAMLNSDSEASIPRIKLGEQGFIGLKTSNTQIIDEANRVFQYPAFLKTVVEMRNNPTVAAAFNVYKMLISRVKWTVKPPIGATEQQIVRAKFVEQCFADMDTSWGSFISEVLTYLEYGFSIQEKVYRRRLRKNGSKYNDGLVGIKKLAPRSQDTIIRWYFSEDGRDFIGVGQSIANLQNGYLYANLSTNDDNLIRIDRDKFLLFTADSTKNNPQGNSLLKPIYLAYKRLELLQDQECLGIAKDLAGIPLIELPPRYLDPDASAEDKAVLEMCKNIVDNLAAGKQSGLVFPKMIDPETKTDLFNITLLERKGTPFFNLDDIIKRYQNDILTALSADVLRMGQNQNGSFALADSKTNLLTLALSHRLGEIAEILNTDLIPQLFALNGWADEELPKATPGDIEEVDMETFSKLVQRIASVGLIEIDRPVLNKIREAAGFDLKPEDSEVDWESLTGASSRSGDGMQTGKSGNGTSDIGGNNSKQDTSTNNNDNKG